jgi:sugar phosphate isomerase/epimerase
VGSATKTFNRRTLICGAAALGGLMQVRAQDAKMRLGIILGVPKEADGAIKKVHDLGFPTCQVHVQDMSAESAANLRAALDKYGVEATSVVGTGPGKEIYDFYQGPLTIGLVPRDTRAQRIAHMKEASDFAAKVKISAVQGHCGFIPENPNDPVYQETVEAIRTVAAYCRQNGQKFRCETGQETPITLVRAIRDVGLDNVGVNFDAANLIMYGKANPVEAVDILGPYIQGVHAKDGLYPTDPKELGKEVAIGQGKVNFPAFVAKLKAIGYRNPLTIEREISGEKQTADILAAKAYLEKLIG